MQTKVKVDWEVVKKLRHENIIKYNIRENKNRINYEYKVGDLILIVNHADERAKERKLHRPTEGPYRITKVHNNGEVTIFRKTYNERIHIRGIKPYRKRNTVVEDDNADLGNQN